MVDRKWRLASQTSRIVNASDLAVDSVFHQRASDGTAVHFAQENRNNRQVVLPRKVGIGKVVCFVENVENDEDPWFPSLLNKKPWLQRFFNVALGRQYALPDKLKSNVNHFVARFPGIWLVTTLFGYGNEDPPGGTLSVGIRHWARRASSK